MGMRKREREVPCEVCEHYHKCDEVCGICGHRPAARAPSAKPDPSLPTEVLKGFLFLGTYDNAARHELLQALNVTHVLNVLPDCLNMYRNSLTYYCLQDDKNLNFDDANRFLEQCEREKSRVLVHCMYGKNRSAAIVIAFLMKSRGWRLAPCLQWVKDRRPEVLLTDANQRQLVEYEQKLFGASAGTLAESVVPTEQSSLEFGFPKPTVDNQVPLFNQMPASSILERTIPDNVPADFVFGAVSTMTINSPENNAAAPASSSDRQMD